VTAVDDAVRPKWRGRIHRYAAVIACPLFVALVLSADSASDGLACAIYGFGVITMLTVSAVYHSAGISPELHRKLRRVDHSTILLAIAGSYTGIATLALDGPPEHRLLAFVWIAAIIGIAVRMLWLQAPYPVIAVVYVVVGWSALIEVNPLLAAMSTDETVLVVAGGLLYTAGAVVYARRRPNPWPATFGYHEVFHTLVVLAATAHLVAAFQLAAG